MQPRVGGTLFVCLCLCISLTLASDPPYPGWRRLQLDDDEPPFWAPARVAYSLAVSGRHFMDLTNVLDRDRDNNNDDVDPMTSKLRKAAQAIPEEPTHQAEVAEYLRPIDMERVRANIEAFSTQFRTRLFNSDCGVASAQWLFDQAAQIASNRTDISVEYFENSFPQPSVIARFEASSSAEDRVIVGAHQDSISYSLPPGSGPAPGADDDASGSFTSFEAFLILAESGFVPQHPLEFHWYAGEEVGLLGSLAIAQEYSLQEIPVRAMLQMDMTGYSATGTIGLITDHTDPELNEFVRLLISEYLTVDYTDSQCGYGCSDHASWNRFGYPASFPFEAPVGSQNPNIHTPNDVVENLDFDYIYQFVCLTLGFAVELSYI